MALNLEKQLLFVGTPSRNCEDENWLTYEQYGAYHHDPVNIGIHIIFVPILLFTGLLFVRSLE